MHRPIRRAAFALAATLLVAVVAARTGRIDEPRSVVLVIIDDLGWADISPNQPDTGYDTPNFERLARDGLNFSRAYTAPVCSPSRVSLMTGRDPAASRTTEWFGTGKPRSARMLSAARINHLPLDIATMAERLKPAGYTTSFVGKWHLGGASEHHPEQRGFDHSAAASGRGNPGRDGYFAPYNDFIGLDAPEGEHLPERLTSETLAFIEKAAKADSPFLSVLSFYSVHTPLGGRPDVVKKYEDRFAKLEPHDSVYAIEEQVWPNRREPRRVRIAQTNAVYAAMVEAVDEQLGRLMDALDAMDLSDDTVLLVVSDNGGLSTSEGSPTSNLPLRGGKGWLYEGGIRVPLLARFPGERGGRTIAHPVQSQDVYATVLDAATIEDDGTRGRSLRAVAAGDAADEPIFLHYPHYANQGGFPGGVVIEGDWKFIRRYEDGRTHLYNLGRDLSERGDLAASEPSRTARMAEMLDRWLIEHDASMLRPRAEGQRPWSPAISEPSRPRP